MKERLNPIFDTIPSSEKISLESRFCDRFLHNPGIRQNEARSPRRWRVDRAFPLRAGHRRPGEFSRPRGKFNRFVGWEETRLDSFIATNQVTSRLRMSRRYRLPVDT